MSSKKKRIHELAKDYGLSGQELATKLQHLGFSDVKGPQSALDEFEVLEVQGRLEAYGIRPQAVTPDVTEAPIGGLTVRKKKKRTTLAEAAGFDEGETTAEAPAPAAEPAPIAERLTAVAPQAPQATVETVAERAPPAVEPAPPIEVAHAPAAVAPTPAPAPTHSHTVAHPTMQPAAHTEPPRVEIPVARPAAAAASSVAETPLAVAPSEEEVAQPTDVQGSEVLTPRAPPAPLPAAPLASPELATPATEVAPTAAARTLPDDLVKPAAKRRPGKVVGFVDLSKMSAAPARTAQTRKLRSKDDVTPDVQPTFGHDKKKALVRGDHAQRGSLTAAQLREKESSRFLRRKGSPTAAPGGFRAAPRPARVGDPGASPLAGNEVKVDAPVTVKKLADALAVKSSQVLVKAMTNVGPGVNINTSLDDETAVLLALEFGVTLVVAQEFVAEDKLLGDLVKARTAVEESARVTRPPTVAFLGHVDHGKTTLLDAIRHSRVAQGESGGITQHIGAYQVTTRSGHPVTILDTPGHEAFTAMRARGAQAVDIVVLVVAADDGVMPSTLEAINHAKAAKTPIVVALNKVDKPEANPSRVKQQLAAKDVLSEEYGGHVGMVLVSALKGTGIEELLERVILESEVLELKSHDRGPASGIVLEAEIQEGKGRVAHLLIKDGTLNQGDVILAGEGYGKVRSIHNDRGVAIKSAGPSMPVEVSGLSELPGVGDQFYVVDKLEQAREVAEERARKNRALSIGERRSVTAESLGAAFAEQAKKTINVILKADVQGSLQALRSQLEGLTHDEVDVRLLHSALGTVTESDVNLAISSAAIVLAFHVGVNDKARIAAERGGIEIRPYEVIYEMLDDMRAMMEGSLSPEMTEQVTGHVEVRALFKSSKFGNIAGCHVIDGVITRDAKVRLTRNKKVVYTGTVASLRREKDDAREVREGFDCGIVLKDYDSVEIGDVVECFKTVAVKRLLKI